MKNPSQWILKARETYKSCIRLGMWLEVSKKLVSWFITYLRDLQPTYIGVIIHLLGTMDIPVGTRSDGSLVLCNGVTL